MTEIIRLKNRKINFVNLYNGLEKTYNWYKKAISTRMNKKKICVVTGTRAEYGLLYWLLREFKKSKYINHYLLATGMHLSPEFGLTEISKLKQMVLNYTGRLKY